MIARPGIDLIPRLEPLGADPDAHNRASHVVPKDERRAIGQEQLEFAIPDLGVEQVHGGCMDAHQNILGTHGWLWHIGQTQRAVFLVFFDKKGFHGVSPV